MAIEYRNRGTSSGVKVVMTACPFCEKDLPDHVGFSDHWPHCDENSNSRGAV